MNTYVTQSVQARSDFITTEVQFNSVELELTRRWAAGEVPPAFVKRHPEDIRKVVKAWWQIYHESTAAANQQSRTVWERSPALPAEALDTSALINALQQIELRLDLEGLLRFRELYQGEHSAIGLLRLITNFYKNLVKQTQA